MNPIRNQPALSIGSDIEICWPALVFAASCKPLSQTSEVERRPQGTIIQTRLITYILLAISLEPCSHPAHTN